MALEHIENPGLTSLILRGGIRMIQANFEMELSWARRHMPLVQQALSAMPDLSGVRIAFSIHLDLKIIILIEGLLQRGASCFLLTCNPSTVRDEVVEYLVSRGAEARAWSGMLQSDYQTAIQAALNWNPTHLCEFGADLTYAIHTGRESMPGIQASLEGTGSGIARLGNMTPLYPIFNWDDLPVKEGLHNRHMVGITTWQTFFERTHLTLHGKRVAVIGYGLVGQGVAATARAFGGSVTIVEKDPVRELLAAYDGWHVLLIESALQEADVVATAAGAAGVVNRAHFPYLRDGMFLVNIGHRADEIDVPGLYAYPHRQVMPFIEEVDLDGGRIYLFAGGSMANLTAGYGDSLNAFDTTLSLMAAGIKFTAGEGQNYSPGVYILPQESWLPFITQQD
jgi:adenosylhomocysteinase